MKHWMDIENKVFECCWKLSQFMQQLGGNLQNKHRIYYDNRIFATIRTILGRPFHKVYEDFIGIFGLPSKIKFVGSDSDVDVKVWHCFMPNISCLVWGLDSVQSNKTLSSKLTHPRLYAPGITPAAQTIAENVFTGPEWTGGRLSTTLLISIYISSIKVLIDLLCHG